MDSPGYWNMRADTFDGMSAHAHGKESCNAGYMPRLIDLLALEEGQSVFDMGCATGTLAIPLARAGHAVCARDFAPRMIEILSERAASEQLPIDAAVMAWEDDWGQHGIKPNSCDVAVASRSLHTKGEDALESIAKLDRVARVKAAVTVSASLPPMLDERLLRHLGREVPVARTHVHVIDALAVLGRYPTLAYIPFVRPMHFDDKDMAYFELRNLAGPGEFDAREESLFEQYAEEHFFVQEAPGTPGGHSYSLDYTLDVMWAFICWRTDGSAPFEA